MYLSTLSATLFLVGNTAAWVRGNTEGKISLYAAAPVSKAESLVLTTAECSAALPAEEISLPVDYCLYGEYFLTSNLKVTTVPTCGSTGKPAVAQFYAGTSCTGKTTFTSSETCHITNSCLFRSSPESWSMIFRCGNTKSQAVEKGHFKQAIPPQSDKQLAAHEHVPTEAGVVTPFFSYDCTINKPKEPTFLPANTCLTLEDGHAIFITQPLICPDGRVAIAQAFEDTECSTASSWLGTDVFSEYYYTSLDKKCHTTSARSLAFLCGTQTEMQKFEDLPPYNFTNVEQLEISNPAPESDSNLDAPASNVYSSTKGKLPNKPLQIPRPTSSTHSHKISGLSSNKPRSATIQPCSGQNTNPKLEPVDKCIWTFMWDSLSVPINAICANGTAAKFQSYARPGCKPDELVYSGDVPAEYEDCADIGKVGSIAFVCDGLPESEIGNKGSIGGLVKFLLVALLLIVVMIGLMILSCCLKGHALMQKMTPVWEQVRSLFNKKEGEIQL